MLKTVPFNSTWITSDKIDVKAMYRRPRWTTDEWGDRQREVTPDGLMTWDLVGPLPVKQHNQWTNKGFEYVTLANKDSLIAAARAGTLPPGTTMRDFDQHATGGPWNYRLYAQGCMDTDRADADRIRADVEKFGPEAVEAIRRQVEPSFTLPADLKKKGKGKAASEPKDAA